MTILAFGSSTQHPVYKKFFEMSRWEELIEQFKKDNYALQSLTPESLLSIAVQSGLSALKTPFCYEEENKNINCPVCSNSLGEIAKKLPFSHRIRSCLVCRITGEIMNEDNPPMVLPNGNVYSQKAMQEMATKNNGFVKDTRDNSIYKYEELRKAFIS